MVEQALAQQLRGKEFFMRAAAAEVKAAAANMRQVVVRQVQVMVVVAVF